MKYTISAPTSEPLTLTEAKAQLRIESSDTTDDTLLGDLISVVREKFEDETGRLLVARNVTAVWDKWPDDSTLSLPIYPAVGVSHVKYTDTDGVLQTVDAADYTVDTVGQSPRVVLTPEADIPTAGLYPNAVEVLYVAGAADFPPSAKQAMLLNLTMLYESRMDMPLKDMASGTRSAQWLAFNHRKDLI